MPPNPYSYAKWLLSQCVFLVYVSTVGSSKYMSTDLLLRHGAKVNMTDERGVSSLHACIFHTVISRSGGDGLSILRRLVSAGAILKPGSPTIQSVSLQLEIFCELLDLVLLNYSDVFGCLPGPNKACLIGVCHMTWRIESYWNLTLIDFGR